MPFYVYRCQSCGTDFERLRGMAQADSATACPTCGVADNAKRKLTTFATPGTAKRGASASQGGGCCGGNCGCGRN